MKLLTVCFLAAALCMVAAAHTRDEQTAEELSAEEIGQEIAARFLEANTPTSLNPVMIIPGLGGSRLYADLNHTSVPHFYCTKHQEDLLLWLKLSSVSVFDCWTNNLRLVYDEETNTYADSPGVSVYVKDFGSFKSVDSLDDQEGTKSITQYLRVFKKAFEAIGYSVENKTLAAAPYDFRRPPSAQSMWFQNMESLVESMSAANGGAKVTVVGHSEGGAMGTYWLAHADPEWKAKFIANWVSLGAPIGGAPQVTRTLVSGSNLGIVVPIVNISIVPPLKLKAMVDTWGSLPWMMPTVGYNDSCLVTGPSGACFGTDNLAPLLEEADAGPTASIYQTQVSFQPDMYAPGVPSHCFAGTNRSTEMSYVYTTSFFEKPDITFGDGDGTIPLRSVSRCQIWETLQTEPVTFKEFPNVPHQQLASDPDILHEIMALVTDAVPRRRHQPLRLA